MALEQQVEINPQLLHTLQACECENNMATHCFHCLFTTTGHFTQHKAHEKDTATFS